MEISGITLNYWITTLNGTEQSACYYAKSVLLCFCRYNDALWKAFSSKLEDSFNHELSFGRPNGHKANVGCLDLCSTSAHLTFIESVGHASMKGNTV